MHFHLVILDLRTSVAVRPSRCGILSPSVTYITFSSVCIRSNHGRYHTSRLTGPWSRDRRRVGWTCRHLDLRLSGELFLVRRDIYLNYWCARCSRCLPVDPFLNQWHPLNMMLRNPMYCFIKWSVFVANSSKRISFGDARLAWIIFSSTVRCCSHHSYLAFWLIDTAYDQVDWRNSRVMVANRFRNVFSIPDVYWILATWQA